MKRNIFQKQEDSEITEPVETKPERILPMIGTENSQGIYPGNTTEI